MQLSIYRKQKGVKFKISPLLAPCALHAVVVAADMKTAKSATHMGAVKG